jgi:hypothetical protein
MDTVVNLPATIIEVSSAELKQMLDSTPEHTGDDNVG